MVADVIDRIYEAATIPELWEGLLEDLSVEHGFEGGVLFTVNANAQRGVFSQGVRDVFDAFLRDGWASRSERARRTIAKNHAGFVRDEDLFSAEEAAVDPLHVELLRPFGLGDVAGSVIESPNGDLTALSFERALARGRTPDDAIQAFDALRPHIARAAVIAGRLELDRARTQVMTLSSIGLPGAVMSTTGRAIALNSEFEALSEQVEVRAHDLVAPRDPKSAALFAQALAGIIPGGRSIPLPRTETAPPAVLHLSPVRRNARDVFPSASWLLVATPLGRKPDMPASLLGGLFDLTAAEAKVAAALIEGLTLQEIAARHSLSVSTIRNQVAAVFAKTGVSRQSEFVLLCGGSPIVRR
ncbi:helix-turn-helix transcriptional regulator [Chenggangzhangella methanolivorans]